MKKILILLFFIIGRSSAQNIDFSNQFGILTYGTSATNLIFTSDSCYIFSGITEHHNGPQYPYLYKVNMAGNALWYDSIDQMVNDMHQVFTIETSNHTYITAGGFNFGGFTLFMNDSSGNEIWKKVFQNYYELTSMVEINNSIYLICDSSNSKMTLMKIDFNGNLLYLKDSIPVLNGRDNNYSDKIGFEIATCGQIYNNGFYTPQVSIIDTLGNILMDTTYSNFQSSYGSYCLRSNGTNLILAMQDLGVIAEISQTGDILWQTSALWNSDFPVDISFSSNQIIITCQTRAIVLDVGGNRIDSLYFSVGGFDDAVHAGNHFGFIKTNYQTTWGALLTQITDTGNILSVSEIQNYNLSIYPDPFYSTISIKSERLIEEIFIYDLQGRLIFHNEYNSEIINLSDLKDGMYLLTAVLNDESKINRKIIKRN